MPRTLLNLPRILVLALIRLYQMVVSPGIAREYLPFLSILFPLWVSGGLQTWRAERFAHGGLARFAL
jgi:hypothetical protein